MGTNRVGTKVNCVKEACQNNRNNRYNIASLLFFLFRKAADHFRKVFGITLYRSKVFPILIVYHREYRRFPSRIIFPPVHVVDDAKSATWRRCFRLCHSVRASYYIVRRHFVNVKRVVFAVACRTASILDKASTNSSSYAFVVALAIIPVNKQFESFGDFFIGCAWDIEACTHQHLDCYVYI